jgi:hypothetical protein
MEDHFLSRRAGRQPGNEGREAVVTGIVFAARMRLNGKCLASKRGNHPAGAQQAGQAPRLPDLAVSMSQDLSLPELVPGGISREDRVNVPSRERSNAMIRRNRGPHIRSKAGEVK